jgi:hypothetical protein
MDPFVEILEHSCIPSLFRQVFDGKLVWIAMRHAKAGEVLTTSFRSKGLKGGLLMVYINCECSARENRNLFEEPHSVLHLIPSEWFKLSQYLELFKTSPRPPNHSDAHSVMAKEALKVIPFLFKQLPNHEYYLFTCTVLPLIFNYLGLPRIFER